MSHKGELLDILGLAFPLSTTPDVISSPVPSTDERALFNRLSLFLFNHQSLLSPVMSPDMSNVKYKSVKLVIPKAGSKRPLVYIKIYAKNKATNEIRLKKFYQIPGETLEEKVANAGPLINQINRALSLGYEFDDRVETLKHEITVCSIIKRTMSEKINTRSSGTRLHSYFKPYIDFCKMSGEYNMSITSISTTHADGFLQYLKEKNISNRTINNYMSYAKNVWNRQVELETITRSPFVKIKKSPTGTGRNLAFKEEQIDLIRTRHEMYPDLALLAKFMYYTLARTNELAQLQVKHIEMYNQKQMYIPAFSSKNGYERHIIIPDYLNQLILETELRNSPMDYYVFSVQPENGSRSNKYKPLEPSLTPSRSSKLGERYREYILKPLGFSKDYTLYSWKHTGVINAHIAGVSDADIMQQTGHRSYESFTKYMKSLGLFAEGQFAKKIPAI
jgi:integrase